MGIGKKCETAAVKSVSPLCEETSGSFDGPGKLPNTILKLGIRVGCWPILRMSGTSSSLFVNSQLRHEEVVLRLQWRGKTGFSALMLKRYTLSLELSGFCCYMAMALPKTKQLSGDISPLSVTIHVSFGQTVTLHDGIASLSPRLCSHVYEGNVTPSLTVCWH
jgi:hypothetical protein